MALLCDVFNWCWLLLVMALVNDGLYSQWFELMMASVDDVD
jgi:hypothetical protein